MINNIKTKKTGVTVNTERTLKRSNTLVVIVIIFLTLLFFGGIGGYLVYRYVQNKVNSVVDNTSVSGDDNDQSQNETGSYTDQDIKNNFDNTNPVVPTSDFGQTNSKVICDILDSVFDDIKLVDWLDLNESNSMGFLLPRKVSPADFISIEKAFIDNGFNKNTSYSTSDEMSVYFSNRDIEILFDCTAGEDMIRATVALKTD